MADPLSGGMRMRSRKDWITARNRFKTDKAMICQLRQTDNKHAAPPKGGENTRPGTGKAQGPYAPCLLLLVSFGHPPSLDLSEGRGRETLSAVCLLPVSGLRLLGRTERGSR